MSNVNSAITDEAAYSIAAGLAREMARHGEGEVDLIESDNLTEAQKQEVMKSNTFLALSVILILRLVEEKNLSGVRALAEMWMSEPVQDLVSIAFAAEIAEAMSSVSDGIAKLEEEINKEN